MNSAYEQAVASQHAAQAKLDHIDNEIQQVQHEYDELSTTPGATATPHHITEQERNRLAKKLSQLATERSRQLNAYTDAQQAIQRELERRVHQWHGEWVHQEEALEQATTSEEAEAATQRRDHAQSELDQHQR
jgi:chromosome segregation ATPase